MGVQGKRGREGREEKWGERRRRKEGGTVATHLDSPQSSQAVSSTTHVSTRTLKENTLEIGKQCTGNRAEMPWKSRRKWLGRKRKGRLYPPLLSHCSNMPADAAVLSPNLASAAGARSVSEREPTECGAWKQAMQYPTLSSEPSLKSSEWTDPTTCAELRMISAAAMTAAAGKHACASMSELDDDDDDDDEDDEDDDDGGQGSCGEREAEALAWRSEGAERSSTEMLHDPCVVCHASDLAWHNQRINPSTHRASWFLT
eukprot:2624819-Rhodomonas_salina.6